jgi:L-iditol 2-dehydrogenase
MKSRRVAWVERAKAVMEDFEAPEPKAGEVLIKTHCSLISPGTERAFFLGLDNTSQKYPMYPGYCNVGEVVALGAGVEGVRVGDRVASSGQHALHTTVPAGRFFPMPEKLSAEHGTFWNMANIALQGVRRSKLELGESVLVMGLGLIGNMAMQIAKLSGGMPVIALDPSESRRNMALACGADAAIAPDNATEALAKLTGTGPAVVLESTGAAEPVNTAFKLASIDARVVLLASTRGLTEKVNFYKDVHCKGLTILGAHNNARPKQDSYHGHWTMTEDAEVVLKLLAGGRIVVDKLITNRIKAENAPEAYQQLGSWTDQFYGTILQWM